MPVEPPVESSETKHPWLLVVDDESEILNLLVRSLRDGPLRAAATAGEALRLLEQDDVAVVVTDQRLPFPHALELVRETLAQRPEARRILLTGNADLRTALGHAPGVKGTTNGTTGTNGHVGEGSHAEGRRSLGDLAELRRFQLENRRLGRELLDAVSRLRDREALLEERLDAESHTLLDRLRALEAANVELQTQARRDGLTQLYNQSTVLERLGEELARARRGGTSLSLLIGDLDDFKAYNQLVGRSAGDACLVQVANLFAANLRESSLRLRASDIVGRWGGETFLVLLPETDASGAAIKAERLRETVERQQFQGAAKLPQARVTISFGVASFPADAQTVEELIARAEEGLLNAKSAGKNRVWLPAAGPNLQIPGQREVGSYRRLLPVLGARLRSEGALAAMSITLTQLAKVEAEYGAHMSRALLAQLEDAVLRAVGLFGETPVLGTCEDESRLGLLIFLPGRRSARCPATSDLSALAERLEGSLSHQLFRLEKLVHAPGRVVVGWGEGVFSSRLPIERLVAEIASEAGESVARRLIGQQSQDRTLLRQLLVEEALTFNYQPIVDREGRRHGCEALVRGPVERGWDRPDHLFWRAAEVGLLDERDRGCALGALRGASGRLSTEELLFINVLPSTLYDQTFVSIELPQAVREADLTPERIVLEVTEQHAIESLAAFQESVKRVTNLGFSVALDDVGTGNSNLHALLEIRPSYVKLDRLLIDGIADNALKRQLIGALVAATAAMPALLIAEGVERQADADELKRQGVGFFQGYLFGRPAAFPGR